MAVEDIGARRLAELTNRTAIATGPCWQVRKAKPACKQARPWPMADREGDGRARQFGLTAEPHWIWSLGGAAIATP